MALRVKIENLNDSPEHYVSLLHLFDGRRSAGCAVAKSNPNELGGFTAVCTVRTMAGEKNVANVFGKTQLESIQNAAEVVAKTGL